MFNSIIDNDERTKFYTGLPSYNLFSALLECIQPKVATSDTSESGRKKKMTYGEENLSVLMCLRLM